MDILSSLRLRPSLAAAPSTRERIATSAGLLLASLVLAGCGNKGPLVPPQSPPPKTSAASAEAPAAALNSPSSRSTGAQA